MKSSENQIESVDSGRDEVIPKNKGLFLLLAASSVLFVICFLFGFYGVQVLKKPEVRITTTPVTVALTDTLPKNLEIIKNPIFTNWTASVKGRIIKKDKISFVLQPIVENFNENGTIEIIDLKDTRTTTIVNTPGKTLFYKTTRTVDGVKREDLSYDALPLGTIVRGSVKIAYINDTFTLIGTNLAVK